MANNIDKPTSRKWILTLMIFWVATALVLLPPVISVMLGKAALVVISGDIWMGVVAIICGIYHTSNVMQKHIENSAQAILNKIPGANVTKDDATK